MEYLLFYIMKAFTIPFLVAAVGASVLCPPCESRVAEARPAAIGATEAMDTATVRLHISRMTCGTCPVTARKALTILTAVYSATVTLPDSLGVIKFDPAKLRPAEIATQLMKMTGYAAKVLPDGIRTRKS